MCKTKIHFELLTVEINFSLHFIKKYKLKNKKILDKYILCAYNTSHKKERFKSNDGDKAA